MWLLGGPCTTPRLRPAMEHGYSEGPHSCQHHLSHTLTPRHPDGCCVYVLEACTHLLSIFHHKHRWFHRLAAVLASSHRSFFSHLRRSVYVPIFNMSLFTQGGHCHLSRLTTSPTFPLRYLRLSLPTLAPLSMTFLADIYWETFTDLSLRGHLWWLCAAFQTVHEDHQGIKLTNYHSIL